MEGLALPGSIWVILNWDCYSGSIKHIRIPLIASQFVTERPEIAGQRRTLDTTAYFMLHCIFLNLPLTMKFK